MDDSWGTASRRELLVELDNVEEAIAGSRTFRRSTDEAGRTHLQVSPELLALAEREHRIVAELRRRGRSATLAA